MGGEVRWVRGGVGCWSWRRHKLGVSYELGTAGAFTPWPLANVAD